MGLSIAGIKSVVELQFADFVSSGFNPIVNYLPNHIIVGARGQYCSRMPCGGVGAGPFHSQTNEAWFTKTPGLKVVYPHFLWMLKDFWLQQLKNQILYFFSTQSTLS